ncbi:MAG: AI-2E family transporter [Desulfobacterales bacterium]|nr:AI-2E family transporter [Desulfobacterales bacterium]
MTKQLVKFSIAIMTTLLAMVVLWDFRIVVIYVLISLILSAVLRPLVNHLVGRYFMVCISWILLYIAVIVSFGFLLFQTGETAMNEIQQMSKTVSVRDEWILPKWLQGSLFQQSLVDRLPQPSKLFNAVTGDKGQFVLPTILSFTQGIGGIVSGSLVILFLSIYWSINQIHFERLWLSLLPSNLRKQARGIWKTVELDIGAYMRVQVILSILSGLLLGSGYWLFGSQCPAFLALVGAMACLIPMIGIALSIIPVLLMGLLTSVQLSLFTALYTLFVMVVLGLWVKPRLLNLKWDNSILTVILLIAMADEYGMVGIIIAPPLSVICQILWWNLVVSRAVSESETNISDIKERQLRLLDTIKTMDEPHLALVISSMERLNILIEKAEPILQTVLPANVLTEEHSEKYSKE